LQSCDEEPRIRRVCENDAVTIDDGQALDLAQHLVDTYRSAPNAGFVSPCPVCGGPTHHELLIGSEEVVCDDTACTWGGAVIDTLD